MMIGQEIRSFRRKAAAALSLSIGAAALGGGVPDYDFDWAVIDDPGNSGWKGEIPILGNGRGAVDYTYRISKKEVSSAQWLEFVQIVGPAIGDSNFARPRHWGYLELFPGDFIGFAPDPANSPVLGITWREAAMYCNWLHNDKQASIEAISNGAYDISTFGNNPDDSFTDQLTRNPDAKFWIPSFDEWIKAAHYDPNRYGQGEGGYWMYSHTSDTAPIPGLPGEGESSAGDIDWADETYSNLDARDIPLGSYPETTSPWGLLDTSGGGHEWTEATLFGFNRLTMGAHAQGGIGPEFFAMDRIDRFGGLSPDDANVTTLRIAAAIPNPCPAAILGTSVTIFIRRRKRRYDS
jgi:hypothetical protein